MGMRAGWGRKLGGGACIVWWRGLAGALSLLQQRGRACEWGGARKPVDGVGVARAEWAGGGCAIPPAPPGMHAEGESMQAGQGGARKLGAGVA